MTDKALTIQQIIDRANTLSADYTEHLDRMVNEMVPRTLSNEEYASRCAALMIALNRELARCAAVFGETHQIDAPDMLRLVGFQFGQNYERCLQAILGEGQTIQ